MTTFSSLILSAGALVRRGRDGGGEVETEAGCRVALEAPRGLHTYGHPASQRGPALRTPGLLQDHDRQGAGQRERPELPGYQSECVWKFSLTRASRLPLTSWPWRLSTLINHPIGLWHTLTDRPVTFLIGWTAEKAVVTWDAKTLTESLNWRH